MGFRQIYIKTAKELRLKDNNLRVIKHDSTEISLPLEDISSILLEDPKTVITARLMTEFSYYSISLILCNEKYLPAAQVLPFNSYYNQVHILKLQLSVSQQLKDNLWKNIIKQKIYNQRRVIELTSGDNEAVLMLENYLKDVKVGDRDNKEAISARVFFNSLYGEDFSRFGSSIITSALNYGYSILNGSIIRQLTCLGLNTNLGIWHESDQNAYNLASDLIEPFRSIVDYYIYWNMDKLDIPLSMDIRKGLINLLNKSVIIDEKSCKVEYAINLVCLSFINCLEGNTASLLKLPKLSEVNFFDEE